MLLLARTLAPIDPRLPALVVVRIACMTVWRENDRPGLLDPTWNDDYAMYATLFERNGDRDAWMTAYRACGCECTCEHVMDATLRELTRDELHADWRR